MAAAGKEPYPGSANKASPRMSEKTDEIYERYLQRAIREINTLGEEIESLRADRPPAPVPVLGSGTRWGTSSC